ncbi:T9SS type A sorting domain-containing protein [Chryseobacterium sp. PBS4-4]|uniref:T9SS type A sorting domain-containing protein n=1 Tax=Chryseobacterium edaphi TaxID=2976532 RepID=A0ABT2W3W2_9FLAO|nr:T9SS type A sorting domain-containing protein [Chryseobacterium edaphi]MCU7616024.1 T9SS type A sorting domain-containing protein [Chryseobacterium edaphi]
MKKIMTAVLALHFAYSSAQITLTKDLSFGNSGVAEIGTMTNSMSQLFPYNTPTFQGDKLFLNQPIYNSSNSFIGRKFFRLNNNGTPDFTFGTSGEISILSSNYESDSFYSDFNKFYLNSGEKYLSNGQADAGFGNINSALTTPYHHYKIVLPDGKIISRNQQSISKYYPTGLPDPAFGNNGVQALISPLENTNTSFGDLIYYDNEFLYEVVIASGEQRYIRKINYNTGNLDTLYGQNGYSQSLNTFNTSLAHWGSSSVPQNNTSFIHNYKNGDSGQLTKTNSTGNLDNNFGINGKIDYADSYVFNGDNYSSAENKPLLYGNYIFLLSASYDLNGTANPTKIAFRGYDQSGNQISINGNVHHILQEINSADTFHTLIKDNYLYIFYGNKISRYIFNQSTLSINTVMKNEDSINFSNPFKDELNLKTDEKIKSTEIYDESGRLVLKDNTTKNIDTSNLQKGIYFIKINTESNQVISKKGIKN